MKCTHSRGERVISRGCSLWRDSWTDFYFSCLSYLPYTFSQCLMQLTQPATRSQAKTGSDTLWDLVTGGGKGNVTFSFFKSTRRLIRQKGQITDESRVLCCWVSKTVRGTEEFKWPPSSSLHYTHNHEFLQAGTANGLKQGMGSCRLERAHLVSTGLFANHDHLKFPVLQSAKGPTADLQGIGTPFFFRPTLPQKLLLLLAIRRR